MRWLITASLLLASSIARAHAGELAAPLPALPAYFALGIEHILLGFDHLVFLLGVILIATRTRTVLLAVTAFTVAHSLTLGLSVLGLVTVSPSLIEALIAASVAYVGLENLWLRGRESTRYRLTFAFGLVHGFGFAGALSEIGVPADRAPAALGLFNLGVEAGQLLVLTVVWPLLAWVRRSHPLRLTQLSRIVNLALVFLGVGWTIERTLGGEIAVATESAPPAPPTELRTVYPRAAAVPLAEQLCRALQRLPRERRAACGGGPAGITLERECTRMLSAALASDALEVDPAQASACVAATEARYATCDFTRATALPPIAACESLWQGVLDAGAPCRSSLECERGLHCHGLSPSHAGVCGAPKPAGEICGGSVDPLAAYLPDRSEEHPECSGQCARAVCQP